MTNWIHITETDLHPHLSLAQRETLAARPKCGTPADPLTALIAQTIADIRTDIRSQEMNILSEDESTLPPELKRTACLLVLSHLPGRIRGFILTEAQEDEIDEAEDVLDDVRSGDLAIRIPTSPVQQPQVRRSLGLEVAHKRTNPLHGDQLNGL